MSLTLADVVVLAIVALSTLVALIRGFVREALSILAWAGAALITAYLFDPLRPLADDMIASETAGDIATMRNQFLERADQAANATAGAAANAARGTLGGAMPGMSRDGAAQAPAAGGRPSGNAAGATPSGGEIGYGDGARHDMNRLLDAIEPETAAPSGGDQTSGAGAN